MLAATPPARRGATSTARGPVARRGSGSAPGVVWSTAPTDGWRASPSQAIRPAVARGDGPPNGTAADADSGVSPTSRQWADQFDVRRAMTRQSASRRFD
jgi:hypothetical protein